jgi:tRNA pseudouridine55 synthase
MNGLLIIDKPRDRPGGDKAGGMTSHDVVNRVRRITGEQSVGHLGTLDPMATGVLPLLLGKWTRLAQYFGKLEKSYSGTIRFGYATDTYDAEGEPMGERTEVALDPERLRDLAASFVGEIEQMPPIFSAKKLGGNRPILWRARASRWSWPPSRSRCTALSLPKRVGIALGSRWRFRPAATCGRSLTI